MTCTIQFSKTGSRNSFPGLQLLPLLVRTAFFLLLFSTAVVNSVSAEARISAESNYFLTVQFDDNFTALFSGGGTGKIGASYRGERNLRGEIELQGGFPQMLICNEAIPSPSVSLSKAYLKARFEEFRVTAGKAPISWSDGLVFNAGDRVLGLSPGSAALSETEMSDSYLSQSAITWYFDSFSFLEAVIFPDTSGKFKAGGRIQLIHGSSGGALKLEGGGLYEYDNADGRIHAFTSIQGNLEADYYVGLYTDAPLSGSFVDEAEENFGIAAGTYTTIPVGFRNSLSVRLEGEIIPKGLWENQTDTEDAAAAEPYGLQLFSDISFQLSPEANIMLRSLISPIAESALIIPGIVWKPMQGLTLAGTGSIAAGSLKPAVYGLLTPPNQLLPRTSLTLSTMLSF